MKQVLRVGGEGGGSAASAPMTSPEFKVGRASLRAWRGEQREEAAAGPDFCTA